MVDRTIKEIKALLQTKKISDALLKSLEADQRQGVKQAVTSYKKMLEKEAKLQEQWQFMQEYERYYHDKGKHYIAGVDEVGRGPLAGPVVAAAVILPATCQLVGLTDSKKLSKKKREYFAKQIQEQAISIGIGRVDNEVIDQINIYQASLLAMEQAIKQLSPEPDQLLIDAVSLPRLSIDQAPIIKGDQKSISIAAASIIAKVTRDKIMLDYHLSYPDYQFDKNQGYGTRAHLNGIDQHGITAIHRQSFAPVRDYI
ncbi:ribonuclease HII [Amphibacillus cookii]|uniref:ribonuclease HII n=1 Tax=Amphibacillus cookii TaxID=767787 RepID=UPI0019597241|nr:ribonuclease HII [Amphibacillus cookii]MBM7540556.1 ribonuclease HII [Amphibacillus cookii]